jgi:ubiquinone/menaquinone biosynthesis C-methylase UbiE
MEKQYVHDAYSAIAKRFNNTRYSYWNRVRCFLDTLSPHSLLGDIGAGNGKYASYRKDLCYIGVDACKELLEYAQQKNPNVVQANGLNLPFKSNTFDALISIAVLHHIASVPDRQRFIKEIMRILKPNGKALITVWALEQQIKSKWQHIDGGDYFIPWEDMVMRYYHLFSESEVKELLETLGIKDYTLIYEKDNWCIEIEKKTV